MTALIIVGVIAAIFIAIGFVRVGVAAKYDENGEFAASVKIAFKTIMLYPRSEKPEKAPKKERVKPEKEEAAKGEKGKAKRSFNFIEMLGGIRGILSLVREVLSDFFGLVYTDRLVFKFVSAKKDDPATVATNYGYACAAAGVISPLLENNKNVTYYSIKLGMDYELDKPEFAGELKFSVSVGRVVRFAVKYGVKLLIMFLKYKRKGGTDNGKTDIQYA